MANPYEYSVVQDEAKSARLNSVFQFYKTARTTWQKRGWENQMLVQNDIDGTGTQFTADELETIKKKYLIPLSINILHPLKEQCQAFLTGLRPSINVIPVGDSSKSSAYVHREICVAATYLNQFTLKQELSIGDAITVGHGVLYLEPNSYYIHNQFNVVIKSLDWNYVYVDPNCKEPDYQDSEYMIIAFPMTKNKAQKVYGLTDEDMTFAEQSIGVEGDGNTEFFNAGYGMYEKGHTPIWLKEIYEKVKVPLYYLQDGSTTLQRPPAPSIGEDGQMINLVVKTEQVVYIKKYLMVGSFIKSETLIPIENYPLFFYVFSYTRNPYPKSLVHHVADVQKTLNKALAITIENAQKASNTGTIGFAGTITDKEEFEKSMSTPGGHTEIEGDPSLPQGGFPIQKEVAPLNQAWYTLYQSLIKIMEYITGIFDLMQGNSENTPNTLGATERLQNMGSQRPKMYARHLDHTHQLLMETLIQFYQAYAPKGNIIRYLDNTEAMVEIKTNIQAQFDKEIQAEIEKAKAEGQDVSEINQEEFATVIDKEAEKEIIKIFDDISVGTYKVRYQSISDLPNTRLQVQGFLQTLLGRTSNDALGMAIIRMLLKVADYPEVDSLMREADIINQLQNEAQRLLQENEALKKQVMKNEEDLIDKEKELKLNSLDVEIDKMKNKLDSEIKDYTKRKKEEEKETKTTNIKEYK